MKRATGNMSLRERLRHLESLAAMYRDENEELKAEARKWRGQAEEWEAHCKRLEAQLAGGGTP